MTAYAMALLEDIKIGPSIVEYLERIDETLAPYDGRFIVHGGEQRMLEGANPGVVVVVEFPDRRAAQAWYDSDAYQQILRLRVDNSRSRALLLDGVEPGHRATDVLDEAPRGS
jgi:uncharacterized protein (DUF1330 family)